MIKILCGVVLFNPMPGAAEHVIEAVVAGGFVPAAFDNSPEAERRNFHRQSLTSRFAGLKWAEDGGNVGLSRAFNHFVSIARSMECDAVVLFDQDSSVDAAFLNALVNRYIALRHSIDIGVLSGMALRDGKVPYRTMDIDDERARLHGLLAVRMTPSSFSLIPLTALDRVGGFHDDFFIDHIDVDFCHRCHRAGLLVAMDPLVAFPHVIGNGYVTVFGRGVSPVSSPFRHYYQARNILLSSQRGGARPLAAALELTKRLIVIGIVGFKAGHFMGRYAFALRGIWDGLRGRGGALPGKVA